MIMTYPFEPTHEGPAAVGRTFRGQADREFVRHGGRPRAVFLFCRFVGCERLLFGSGRDVVIRHCLLEDTRLTFDGAAFQVSDCMLSHRPMAQEDGPMFNIVSAPPGGTDGGSYIVDIVVEVGDSGPPSLIPQWMGHDGGFPWTGGG